MPIDTAAKRKSAAATIGPPWLPGVTPNASKPVAWRQQAGWGYSGIAVTDEVVVVPKSVLVVPAFNRTLAVASIDRTLVVTE